MVIQYKTYIRFHCNSYKQFIIKIKVRNYLGTLHVSIIWRRVSALDRIDARILQRVIIYGSLQATVPTLIYRNFGRKITLSSNIENLYSKICLVLCYHYYSYIGSIKPTTIHINFQPCRLGKL